MQDYTRQEMELILNIYCSTDRHAPYSPSIKDLNKLIGWNATPVLGELMKKGLITEVNHRFKVSRYQLTGFGSQTVDHLINLATDEYKGGEPLNEKYAGIVRFEVEHVADFMGRA